MEPIWSVAIILGGLLVFALTFVVCVYVLWRSFEAASASEAVGDPPLEAVAWLRDASVFDHPHRFGYKVFTSKHDQIFEAKSLEDTPGRTIRQLLIQHALDKRVRDTRRLTEELAQRRVGEGLFASLLIDHSGSMTAKPGGRPPRGSALGQVVAEDSAAVLAAGAALAIAAALEARGAATEILGFTTTDWRGGQCRADWLEAHKPPRPGRLNALLHVIYKSADEPSVIECAPRLGTLLNPHVLKENIDGEAIAWARERLLRSSLPDRLLIVLSDGAPVDDATLHENGPSYLRRHLTHVVEDIEQRRDMRILGLGIGVDVADAFPAAMTLEAEWSAADIERLARMISGAA